MSLAKRYDPQETEPALQGAWEAEGTHAFHLDAPGALYTIDTPPATVSGHLHLGHVYSYSHPDFMARYFRMRGRSVFYPMGFDDNGLPTERLVEKRMKITARQVGREAFVEACLRESVEAEKEYHHLWSRLGLSIDWNYTYRTIDESSRRVSQSSFIDLYSKGLAYRSLAPTIWCTECGTAIAQAEQLDKDRDSEYVTLPFITEGGDILPVATTRPELLAACVAVFVNPADGRYAAFINQTVTTPLYHQPVTVLPDPAADPSKGTGAVMCCTFGDQADFTWWQARGLPLIEAIERGGRMSPLTGEIAGLPIAEARGRIKEILDLQGLILARQPTTQSIRVHERCDTPVEYLVSKQWFIRVLDGKEKFLDLGDQLRWHPESMRARYQAWVENLNWDWCISRQRFFGVPFPVWYCADCGEIRLAEPSDLPVDPLTDRPACPCPCGSTRFEPERDIMDTWATSSTTPEIVTRWLDDPAFFERMFPLTLRAQGFEIINTWTFTSIVKSWYHFGRLPWAEVLISGWGLAGEGMEKISKSRGGGPMPPRQMIEKYSADAVRYWAASTATGRSAVISEEKIQAGAKLATKLWNVARFTEPFLGELLPESAALQLTPTDRWILARLDETIWRATDAFEDYEYATAKSEIEAFFWRDLADNYLEMAKQRLYDPSDPGHHAARFVLKTCLNRVIKLLAPLLPFVTDAVYRGLFAAEEGCPSVHQASWPEHGKAITPRDLEVGELLVTIASAVRRYKSEQSLSLGAPLARLRLDTDDPSLARSLQQSAVDLASVTRARSVITGRTADPGEISLLAGQDAIRINIIP